MKFYRTKGLPATTWNPKTDRAMYHFTDGVFETEDPDMIKFMQDLGYRSEPVPTVNQPVEELWQSEESPAEGLKEIHRGGRPKKV
jgi:hypothetical protein